MYNPANLNECQKEKVKRKIKRRHIVDGLMTGIGLIASFSSLPQIIKISQTGSVEGISLLTYIVALFTVIAWFSYGIYIKNKPLMITTSISILVLGAVVVQILSHI